MIFTLLCIALGGCARRLPGPDECHDFALVWVLGSNYAGVKRVGAATAATILDRTNECLTTPYDRELVQCVTRGGRRQSCLTSFDSRRRRLPASSEQ